MALQMLYQQELGKASLSEVVQNFNIMDFLLERFEDEATSSDPRRALVRLGQAKAAFPYAVYLFRGTLARREEIDRLIREQARNWRIERMPVVDRNILRLAIFELLEAEDVPKIVILDEAVDLAKLYGSEQSGRFVNGILDGLLRSRFCEGRLR
jgi:N utilization substance protein B